MACNRSAITCQICWNGDSAMEERRLYSAQRATSALLQLQSVAKILGLADRTWTGHTSGPAHNCSGP